MKIKKLTLPRLYGNGCHYGINCRPAGHPGTRCVFRALRTRALAPALPA